MSNEPEWWDAEKELVVVPQVDAIAIYMNERGNVVIRQRDSMGEPDTIVAFPPSHIDDIVLPLTNLKQ